MGNFIFTDMIVAPFTFTEKAKLISANAFHMVTPFRLLNNIATIGAKFMTFR